jgi:tetratricopeptide (TPR) repeat protein
MQQALESRHFSNVDDANAFLQSPEFRQAMDAAKPTSPLQRAQEVAYEAWASRRPKRYERARRALEIDERCSDAWLILAEQEPTWVGRRRSFEKAVAAAEREGREEGWFPGGGVHGGSLYEHLPARPLFRAKMALARLLMDRDRLADARVIYEELLHLDVQDHMGARYEVLQVYHRQDDMEALRRLLSAFRTDQTAYLSYERVWLAIVEDAPDATLKATSRRALRANPHVPAYLLGLREPPKDELPRVQVGGEDEAADYAAMASTWWLGTPDAVPWLAFALETAMKAVARPFPLNRR